MTAARQGQRVISGLGDTTPARGKAALNVLELDPRTYSRARDCVHCGLCLPACPTYTTNGLEADSPRGRIMLMKGMADGKVEPTDSVRRHLDLCLDCRACETACPSGVIYHELIEETRAKLAATAKPTLGQRLIGRITDQLFPYPGRLKLALIGPRLIQKIGLWGVFAKLTAPLLPAELAKMQQMLPSHGPLWERPLKPRYPATPVKPRRNAAQSQGTAAASKDAPIRVAFFPGCVGSVLFQSVNRQSVEMLQHCGCEVVVPPEQACCGAMHHHGGHVERAIRFAKTNIDAMLGTGTGADGRDDEPAMIVTNIAGCGAMLRDYDHLLRDDAEYADKAKRFVSKVRDISEALFELGLEPTHTIEKTVTYHDACHLLHAQKVANPPRALLARIDGLQVVPLPESDMCCGAAGTYNLTEPVMAKQLGQRKVGHIERTGAAVCVTGNVGCAMQIQSEAARAGQRLEVVHPVTLLHEATFGPDALPR